MIEEPKRPRLAGDELIVETQGMAEAYDVKYLVAALLVFVAKGDGQISGSETAEMLRLFNDHFGLQSAESLGLITNAMEDITGNPDFENLIRELSVLVNVPEKEEIALMMLKVAAADGRKNAEELEKVRLAAELISTSAETLHRAYDRYFSETMTD